MSELEQRDHIPQQNAWFEEAVDFLTPPTETIASESASQSSSAQVRLLPSGSAFAAGPPAIPIPLSVVPDPNGAASTATSTANNDSRYKDIIESMICNDFAHVSDWEDITVDAKLKEAMTEQILLPLALPTASSEGVAEGILLHGVPGCGKTYLCRAQAKTAGVTFFDVKPSSLISNWQGESAKYVTRTLWHQSLADIWVG